ncbi:MAG: HAD family hydrolase [Fuerstiella sp.]
MSLTLAEYADSLDERELIWPQVPAPKPVKAKPSIDRLPDIKAVLWDVYGTLLRTPDGAFTVFPEQEIYLQVALEKTIHEFHMWHSMYRKPGPPWQSMIHQYRDYAERLAMAAPQRSGDLTDVSLVHVWRGIIDRLFDKEYSYDEGLYGDVDELSEKVAYFFHCNLQAVEARAGSAAAISELMETGVRQGLLADGQAFTMVQLVRALLREGQLPPIGQVLPGQHNVLSFQLGIRKPSPSLFRQAVAQFEDLGIHPSEILHVSCRLKKDLAPAKAAGMKTALLAAEKTGLEATADLLKDPQIRPDRLLTDISQITSVVGFG